MTDTYTFPDIDTSYWKVGDKGWVEDRKAQWPAIERMVSSGRKKTEVNVIKQYFLKGKLPNWEKYKKWDDIFRPLDLRMFLWLHPSDDPVVLKSLYTDFIQSESVHRDDIPKGYGAFLDNELLRATSPYKSLEQYTFVYMGNKNRVLFNILFDDLTLVRQRLSELFSETELIEYVNKIFEAHGYLNFCLMKRWLMPKYETPMSEDCLYQYPEVVDWCMTTLTSNQEHAFLESIENEDGIQAYQEALYCFHHFDTEKEGDTCRTRFVQKIRKILDERDFIPEFKQMWLDVKSGRIEVENAWER